MTYAETLQALYARLPVYHRQGNAALTKDLSNTRRLLDALGNPQQRFRSIHVGGTNGKGSVSSMLASVLQASGVRKVGLYTSPHLVDFAERIRVDGAPIAHDYVVDFVARHDALIASIQPSFFELTVAMAFGYFADQGVDTAVVEVGLGGRLDSTNVITPLLSVVTNISWDHAEVLGDTLGKIAAEKAGIFKSDVPAVVGQVDAETRLVFVQAAAVANSPLRIAQDEWQVQATHLRDGLQHIVLHGADSQPEHYALDLLGAYQADNLVTLRTAVDVLRSVGYGITDAHLAAGLAHVRRNTGLRGRMERLGEQPTLIADVAHNEAGLHSTLQQFMAEPAADRHIVFGVVQEKDLEKILPLLPHENVTYYFVRPDIPRGLDATELQDAAEQFGLIGAYYPSVAAGLKAARAFAAPEDAILVTGSTFVVAEVLTALAHAGA